MFFRNFFRLFVTKKSNACFRRCCHLTHARSTLNFSWFQPPAAGGGGCLPMSFFIFDVIIFALIHRPHCWSWTFLQCVVVWPCEPMHESWNLQPGVKWWSEGRSSSPFEIHRGSCPQYLGNGLSKSKTNEIFNRSELPPLLWASKSGTPKRSDQFPVLSDNREFAYIAGVYCPIAPKPRGLFRGPGPSVRLASLSSPPTTTWRKHNTV